MGLPAYKSGAGIAHQFSGHQIHPKFHLRKFVFLMPVHQMFHFDLVAVRKQPYLHLPAARLCAKHHLKQCTCTICHHQMKRFFHSDLKLFLFVVRQNIPCVINTRQILINVQFVKRTIRPFTVKIPVIKTFHAPVFRKTDFRMRGFYPDPIRLIYIFDCNPVRRSFCQKPCLFLHLPCIHGLTRCHLRAHKCTFFSFPQNRSILHLNKGNFRPLLP